MSVEKQVRGVLSEASIQYKKLDQLVRQGMMSPAALPILHRGLDKMQAGQVLNPQEREAVNKVLQSMLYIVTGDDTVFQKARQHTQKNKYQTESKEEYDKEGEMAKSQLSTISDAAKELMSMLSDDQNLPEWVQSKITKAVDYLDTARDYIKSEGDNGKAHVEEVEEAVISTRSKEAMDADNKMFTSPEYKKKMAAKQPTTQSKSKSSFDMDAFKKRTAPDMNPGGKYKNEEAEEVEEGAFKSMVTKDQENKRLGKTTMIANPKTQKVRKVTPSRAKMAVKKGFVYAEEWTDEELDSLFEMDYKEKFAAMLKKTGKSLESMSDEEKKKFFNSVDAAHKANNEEVDLDEGARADAMRAMKSDKKGMAPVKKDGGAKSYKGKAPGEERHGGHIVMQLRKAVSINKPVKFKDGKEHKVSRADAHKFLSKYNAAKPADREKMHSAHDSHDDFQSHINNK